MEIKHKGSLWSTSNAEQILKRKRALIYRDPLTSEYLDELRKYDGDLSRNSRSIDRIKVRLESKWNVFVVPTFALRLRQGIDYRNVPEGVTQQQPLVIINRFSEEPLRIMVQQPFEYWLPVSPNEAILKINLDLINMNDTGWLKKEIYRVIAAKLKDSKRPRRSASEATEPKELEFLYHIGKGRRDTFEDYLRWYDIHTKENIGWRLIAFLEKHKDNVATYNQWLEKILSSRWKVGTANPQRKGEDRVEKGVKLIYKAIHRREYSRRTNVCVIDEWACPIHGSNLQTGSIDHPGRMQHGGQLKFTCPHCKDLYDKFNRLYPEDRGWVPTHTHDEIDRKILKASGKLPKKNTRYNDER